MGAPARRHVFTFAEYVEIEAESLIKHEFLDGQVYAMAGGTYEHAGLAASVTVLLGAQLQGRRCRLLSSDMRVRVRATGLATYPDLTIVCGRPELDPEDRKGHSLTNPRVLVEVLSPSTAAYDRGEKLDHYKQIESLEEIVLIAHDATRIDVWRREQGSWTCASAGEGERAELRSIECTLDVGEVYRDPLAT